MPLARRDLAGLSLRPMRLVSEDRSFWTDLSRARCALLATVRLLALEWHSAYQMASTLMVLCSREACLRSIFCTWAPGSARQCASAFRAGQLAAPKNTAQRQPAVLAMFGR